MGGGKGGRGSALSDTSVTGSGASSPTPKQAFVHWQPNANPTCLRGAGGEASASSRTLLHWLRGRDQSRIGLDCMPL